MDGKTIYEACVETLNKIKGVSAEMVTEDYRKVVITYEGNPNKDELVLRDYENES